MRRIALACSSLVAAAALVQPGGIAAAQSVSALRAEFDRASDRLAAVTESYNQARLRRAELDGDLAAARAGAARSEAKMNEVRARLGVAVRDLYMHPGAGIEGLFNLSNFTELQRRRELGARAAISVEDVLLDVRRVRAEEQAAAARLGRIRDEARRRELAVAEHRSDAAAALERTRSLLRGAQGALAAQLAAERTRDLAAADDIAERTISDPGPARPGAATAVARARSQIGKPYRWGAEGPDAYDCSGLTMYAWAGAGVSLPHSSRAQYASLRKVPLSQLAPGDLIFRGNPIHHVGIYSGGGKMIHAPQSGETVRESSAFRGNIVGAARP